MKRYFYRLVTLLIVAMAVCSCKKDDGKTDASTNVPQVGDDAPTVKGDSMLYGLSCDGTGDSVVVIWPFKGDPITLNCIDAKAAGKIIGRPEIGDWIGVVLDPEDKTAVTMVVDLDAMKGTWTYPVMPVMKDFQHMSRRAQRRMMAHLDDSIKKNYLIPREYGFTLKRGHVAQAVGRVHPATSLEDDSPVSYPAVKNYQKWYMLNGRLVLVSGDRTQQGTKPRYQLDTLDLVSMTADSLVLMNHGIRCGFHRKLNAMEANKTTQEKFTSRK